MERVVGWESRDIKNGEEVLFNLYGDLLKWTFNEIKGK